MLEYEKKLYLDEHWEKLQSCTPLHHIFSIIGSLICYTILYTVLKWLLHFIPNLTAWSRSAVVMSVFSLPLTWADIICFSVGVLLYLYASIRFC